LIWIGKTLVFARAAGATVTDVMERGTAESSAAYKAQEVIAQHPMIGALKGLLWIDASLDLTKPALDPDEWEGSLNEKVRQGRARDMTCNSCSTPTPRSTEDLFS
jgi:hypothetical protein